MKITEIKVKLVARSDDKLLAFASVTFDNSFVVRDIKIIQGGRGLFVAMPSRKITDRCPGCSAKNHLQARHCNHCGKHLAPNRTQTDGRGRAKLHADIAHPINSRYRNELQAAIIAGYQKEQERSKQPGYVPISFDDDAGPEGHDAEFEPDEIPAGETLPASLSSDPPEGDPKSVPPQNKGKPPPGASPSTESPPDGGGFGVFG